MPTYRTNALYQAPTVDNAVYEQFGMQPGMDRLNLLPRHDAKLGWIAPNALYQIARAIVSPGVAAQGGNVSPEDGVNFAGNVSLGSLGTSALMKRPAPGPGRTVAQTVYHGSPHNFDKFDMSKIGTGEGAQAYGHGLYVAESPDVAKQYHTALSTTDTTLNGQKVLPIDPNFEAASTIAIHGYDNALAIARRNASEQFLTPQGRASAAALAKQIESLKGAKIGSQKSGGVYHVDLPDHHIANMLDWDKPLSQQPESVKRALGAAIESNFKITTRPLGNGTVDLLLDGMTVGAFPASKVPTGAEIVNSLPLQGKGFYELLASKLQPKGSAQYRGVADKAASEQLRALGIPGIRYLDGGSRGAGDGTRNFVVFDDKLLKVLKKE